MPIQVYRCPEHEFEISLKWSEGVPVSLQCPVAGCGKESAWVPPTVSFPGGPTTGAKPPSLPEE